MNSYIAEIPSVIVPYVNIRDKKDLTGRAMRFDSVAGWVCVENAGKFESAGPDSPGIYTRNLLQCYGVVLIDWNLDENKWNKARMAHVSHSSHSIIRGCNGPRVVGMGRRGNSSSTITDGKGENFYDGYTTIAQKNLWLVIGRKLGNNDIYTLISHIKKNLSSLQDDHIWFYKLHESIQKNGVAVSCKGFFGDPSLT